MAGLRGEDINSNSEFFLKLDKLNIVDFTELQKYDYRHLEKLNDIANI